MNRDLNRFRLFFIIYGLANLGLALYGILALITPEVLIIPYNLHVYQFPEGAFRAITYVSALFRLLGYFNLLLGIIGLSLLWGYRIHQNTWLLFGVMFSTFLAYLGPIVFDNTVGHIGFFEVVEHLQFLAMIVSGLIMLRGKECLVA